MSTERREIEVERGVFSASPTRDEWVPAILWYTGENGTAYVQRANLGVGVGSPLWCPPARWREVSK